jgi:hypothetical protein
MCTQFAYLCLFLAAAVLLLAERLMALGEAAEAGSGRVRTSPFFKGFLLYSTGSLTLYLDGSPVSLVDST